MQLETQPEGKTSEVQFESEVVASRRTNQSFAAEELDIATMLLDRAVELGGSAEVRRGEEEEEAEKVTNGKFLGKHNS